MHDMKGGNRSGDSQAQAQAQAQGKGKGNGKKERDTVADLCGGGRR